MMLLVPTCEYALRGLKQVAGRLECKAWGRERLGWHEPAPRWSVRQRHSILRDHDDEMSAQSTRSWQEKRDTSRRIACVIFYMADKFPSRSCGSEAAKAPAAAPSPQTLLGAKFVPPSKPPGPQYHLCRHVLLWILWGATYEEVGRLTMTRRRLRTPLTMRRATVEGDVVESA